MRDCPRFHLGEIVKHKYQNNHGYISKVHNPYLATFSPHNEAYTVTWFKEELNDRLNKGYDQIEHGDILLKVS
jgi:hypothetical protein